MTRTAPLHQALVERLRGEAARRGLTPQELSRRAGYSKRTALRLLSGGPVSWDSIERTENALRVDILDCRCPGEGKEGAGRSRTEQEDRPIVGWEQAARALQVSRWTLQRKRKRYDPLREAWWPNLAALFFWYDGLMSGERVP